MIKGATTTALDHLRNVHGIAISAKSKKKEGVATILGMDFTMEDQTAAIATQMNIRDMHLLLAIDMILGKASMNIANSVTRAAIAKKLTGNARASFTDKRAKVRILPTRH